MRRSATARRFATRSDPAAYRGDRLRHDAPRPPRRRQAQSAPTRPSDDGRLLAADARLGLSLVGVVGVMIGLVFSLTVLHSPSGSERSATPAAPGASGRRSGAARERDNRPRSEAPAGEAPAPLAPGSRSSQDEAVPLQPPEQEGP